MKIYILSLIIVSLSCPSFGQDSGSEKLVKDVVVAFQGDFNDGGFKNAEFYTTRDWIHINPGGGVAKGREVVLKEVRSVHQTFLKGVSMSIESMTIGFPTPETAIATVIHRIDTYELPEGVKHENERQMKTYIIIKQNSKWLLALDQNTVIAAH
jgi:uncharacterized protein (TIGR02246 family)